MVRMEVQSVRHPGGKCTVCTEVRSGEMVVVARFKLRFKGRISRYG